MQWGSWKFYADSRELVHSGSAYRIPVDEIHSSAALVDWIFQIQAKEWATPSMMYDLLAAFHDILHPQANYCSGENDLRPDAEDLVNAFVDGDEGD